MILPQGKLIVCFGATALPAAFAIIFAPALAGIAIALLALVMLWPLLDLVFSLGRLDKIRVEAPPTSRLTQNKQAAITLRIFEDPPQAGQLRIGLPLPPDLQAQDEDQTVLLSEELCHQATVLCRPLRRGRFHARRCYLGRLSWGGFWMLRQTRQVAMEVCVYPDLTAERRRLAGVFLNRGTAGMHAQRQIGHGRDFEQLREYVSDDAFDEICWKASARRGMPITKVFQLERTQEVYVAVDTSRLSARRMAEGETTALDRYIDAAMMLGMVAQRQGDRFGMISFSDKVDTFIRAGTGPQQYRACREAIYGIASRMVTPDFTELFSSLRLRLRRRALLVLLTDLDDPILAEQLRESVKAVSCKHLVLVNMIQPPQVNELFSQEQPPVDLDGVYGRLVSHLQYMRLVELEKVLRQRGVGFYLSANPQLCADVVRQYLNVKKRQLL